MRTVSAIPSRQPNLPTVAVERETMAVEVDGVEVDEETHEVIGDTPLPDGWTIE